MDPLGAVTTVTARAGVGQQPVELVGDRLAAGVHRVDQRLRRCRPSAPHRWLGVGEQERDRVDDQRRVRQRHEHPARTVDHALAPADLDDGQALVGEAVDVAAVGQAGGERVERERHGEPAVALDRAPLAALAHDAMPRRNGRTSSKPAWMTTRLDLSIATQPACAVAGDPGQAVGEAADAEVAGARVDQQPAGLVDQPPGLDPDRADPGHAVAERLDVGELRPDRPRRRRGRGSPSGRSARRTSGTGGLWVSRISSRVRG